MTRPTMGRTRRVHAVEVANSRKASELTRIVILTETVAETAYGLDQIGRNLLAQAPDEDLDGVGIAVEILLVEMLDQLRARDHPALMQHEIGEQPVLVGREFDELTVARHPRRLGVEPQGTAFDLALGMSGRTAHLRADAGEQLLHV